MCICQYQYHIHCHTATVRAGVKAKTNDDDDDIMYFREFQSFSLPAHVALCNSLWDNDNSGQSFKVCLNNGRHLKVSLQLLLLQFFFFPLVFVCLSIGLFCFCYFLHSSCCNIHYGKLQKNKCIVADHIKQKYVLELLVML